MVSVAIIGSGPYGLSLAAHLASRNVDYRIFGPCMEAWEKHMPPGMFLKSDGFASDLYAPGKGYRLSQYCEEHGIPFAPVGLPVKRATFVDYGKEFQRRFVPGLEETMIVRLSEVHGGFELETAEGERVHARRVVLAVGISHFPYLPKVLEGLPRELVSHTFHHGAFDAFAGKRVLVIGAGASSVNAAVALNEAGAKPELMARANRINFHTKSDDVRPLLERLRRPRSVIGTGWRSKAAVELPLVFHALPQQLRHRTVALHLGPAPGWFSREGFEGRVPAHLGCQLQEVIEEGSKVKVRYTGPDGVACEMVVDHVIAGTGFKPLLSSLKFLDQELAAKIVTAEGTPLLNTYFESSVEGLYATGLASANNFGPMCRFACGAKFTSERITKSLRKKLRATSTASFVKHVKPMANLQQD